MRACPLLSCPHPHTLGASRLPSAVAPWFHTCTAPGGHIPNISCRACKLVRPFARELTVNSTLSTVTTCGVFCPGLYDAMGET